MSQETLVVGHSARAECDLRRDLLAMKMDNVAAPNNCDVNYPAHYRTGKIEVIDFIEDQKLGFRLGNVVKYVCRHAHKGSPLKDLKKARWYLEREIAAMEREDGQ